MASVSAMVSIGHSHPNDNGFSPSWTAELWEGDRATWVLRPIAEGKRVRRVRPESPDLIFDSLLDLLQRMYKVPLDDPKAPTGITMLVTVLHGSTLSPSLRRFKALKGLDVHLAPVSWDRTWSRWTGKWDTREG